MAWKIFNHFVLRSTGFGFENLYPLKIPSEIRNLIGSLNQTNGDGEDNQHQLDELNHSLYQEHLRTRLALKDITSQESFLEAVFLSSPDMLSNLEKGYLAHQVTTKRNSKSRRWERKAISYVQRFCTKNETASFFGPKNYGEFVDQEGQTAELRFVPAIESGKQISMREVYWAYWTGCGLAEQMSKEHEIKPFLKPRVNPLCEITRQGIYFHLVDRPIKLNEKDRSILSACDGTRTTREIAENLKLDLNFVLERIEKLNANQILFADLMIPYASEQPVADLLRTIEHIHTDDKKVHQWRAVLTQLEEKRKAFRDSSLAVRRSLLNEVEQKIQQVTGQNPRRGSGQIYADRFVFYEECKGVIERLRFSKHIYHRINKQLQSALTLSGYYGYLIWRQQQCLGRKIFESIAKGRRTVPFTQFLKAAKAYENHDWRANDAYSTSLFTRINDTLNKTDNGTVLEVSLHELAVPESGYLAPRYGLIDLMIEAESFQAIEAEQYNLIFTGVHPHLPVWSWLTSLYPDRAKWETNLELFTRSLADFSDLADIRVARRNKAFYCFPGKQIEYLSHVDGDRNHLVSLTDLEVAIFGSGKGIDAENSIIRLRSRSTGEWIWLYLALADFADYIPLCIFASPSFRRIPFQRPVSTPRIIIDKVVYQRQRWQVKGHNIVSSNSEPLETSFIKIWQMKKDLGMPDQVYAKGTTERKPIFVDFDNPLLLELLINRARKWESILFEEMLPGPDGMWLKQNNESFSNEIRIGVFSMSEA